MRIKARYLEYIPRRDTLLIASNKSLHIWSLDSLVDRIDDSRYGNRLHAGYVGVGNRIARVIHFIPAGIPGCVAAIGHCAIQCTVVCVGWRRRLIPLVITSSYQSRDIQR